MRLRRPLAEEELHHHAPSRGYSALDDELQDVHSQALDASAWLDQVAKNWPESQRRYLHGKAVERHIDAANQLHAAGFWDLAQQHMQTAHYHAAHAVQHGPQDAHLVRHPSSGGHARSGHTLPDQPSSVQHVGDAPTAAISHKKAKETDQHWNARTGSYQTVPTSCSDLSGRADLISKSVDKISHDPHFSHVERAHHHRVAVGHHVRAAQAFLRHGFDKQSARHMQTAQAHAKAAAAHDEQEEEIPNGVEDHRGSDRNQGMRRV